MTPLTRVTAATSEVLRALVEDGDQGASGVWGLLIVKRTGRPTGTVYPILERLEGAGWVASTWEADTERSGPRRRLYALLPEGRQAAQKVLANAGSRQRRVRSGSIATGPVPAAGA